jgi:hypothetical protein
LLEFIEEALGEVALAIESEVARQRAAGMGRNDRSDLPVGESFDEGISVISFVADQSRWIGILDQGLCTGEVAGLAGQKHQLADVVVDSAF